MMALSAVVVVLLGRQSVPRTPVPEADQSA
jgi:hypothetical protein